MTNSTTTTAAADVTIIIDNQNGTIWGVGATAADALADANEQRWSNDKITALVDPHSSEFRQSGACPTVFAAIPATAELAAVVERDGGEIAYEIDDAGIAGLTTDEDEDETMLDSTNALMNSDAVFEALEDNAKYNAGGDFYFREWGTDAEEIAAAAEDVYCEGEKLSDEEHKALVAKISERMNTDVNKLYDVRVFIVEQANDGVRQYLHDGSDDESSFEDFMNAGASDIAQELDEKWPGSHFTTEEKNRVVRAIVGLGKEKLAQD